MANTKAEPGTVELVPTKDERIATERKRLTKIFRPMQTLSDHVEDAKHKANERRDVRDTYAIGGCDLSATTDLTCATLITRKPGDETVYVLQQYFLPESRINQRHIAPHRMEMPEHDL